MRLAFERMECNWVISVGAIDFQKRQLLMMKDPQHGMYLNFRWTDESAIRSLRVGDRIRVRFEWMPYANNLTCYNEFRGYEPVQ
jgi:hypothetical protein